MQKDDECGGTVPCSPTSRDERMNDEDGILVMGLYVSGMRDVSGVMH